MNQFILAILVWGTSFLALTGVEAQTIRNKDRVVIWEDTVIQANESFKAIVVMGGNLTLEGKTESLVVIGGDVHLTASAVVSDELVVIGGSVKKDEGAMAPDAKSEEQLSWKERFKNFKWDKKWMSDSDWDFGWGEFLALPFLIAIPFAAFVVLSLLALLFFSVAPGLSNLADAAIKAQPWLSLIWGFVGWLAIVPVMVVLAISIVGIPMIPLFVIAVFMVILAGFFCLSRIVGSWILEKAGIHNRMAATLLGMILYTAVGFAPLVGQFLVVCLLMAGSGALLRGVFDTRSLRTISYRYSHDR